MNRTPRRIVTGHNEQGRSCVLIDTWPGEDSGKPWRGREGVWSTDGTPEKSRDATDCGVSMPKLEPLPGGTSARYVWFPGAKPGQTPEEMEAQSAKFFAALDSEHTRTDTTRHPGMHKTKTVDYLVLLSGEITLMLDEGEVDLKPFDVVVQRGTNHAWINKSSEPALGFAVLVDAEIE